jgi:hypothetical protein
MTAFCLRSWRRNGIACDELIFLPGTAYAEKNIGKEFSKILPINIRILGRTEPEAECVELVDIQSPSTSYKVESISDDIESTMASDAFGDTSDGENAISQEEKVELLPLTMTDENKNSIVSPSRLWKNCRRTNNAPDDRLSTTNVTSQGMESSTHSQNSQFKGIHRFFATKENNEYAPSGPKVASAGVDLFMPVLFNFHVFMVLTHGTDDNPNIPPQVLPLIFLSILMIRSVCPFGARRRFWGTIQSTVWSIISGVKFRDEFIAEVATSMVRPLQDICFAIFYYVYALYGISSGLLELEETGDKLKNNILLHNIVIPVCAILPLIIRTFQTFRQAYDEQRRWPHMGNCLKYVSASFVIFYGMTHSEVERSIWWSYSFVLCVLYQIWWDLFIDWEILRVVPREEVEGLCCASLRRIQLRSTRLFKNNRTYWRIICYNTAFRFIWMLSFIPTYHINIGSREKDFTFSSDYLTVVGFAISLGEMLRRSFWCLLRLEIETIRKMDSKYIGNFVATPSLKIQYSLCAPKEAENHSSQRQSMKWAAYRLMVKRLFFLELFVLVSGYVALSLWVAAII